MTMDEMLARAMADPTSMDPTMLAAALPQLQSQVRQHCNTNATPLQQNWNTTKRAYGHIGVTSMCGLDARKRDSFGIRALYRHRYSILYTALFHFYRALFSMGSFIPSVQGSFPFVCGSFATQIWQPVRPVHRELKYYNNTATTRQQHDNKTATRRQQYGNSTANLLC